MGEWKISLEFRHKSIDIKPNLVILKSTVLLHIHICSSSPAIARSISYSTYKSMYIWMVINFYTSVVLTIIPLVNYLKPSGNYMWEDKKVPRIMLYWDNFALCWQKKVGVCMGRLWAMCEGIRNRVRHVPQVAMGWKYCASDRSNVSVWTVGKCEGFLYKLGKWAVETVVRLSVFYWNEGFKKSAVYNWYNQFKNNQESLEDGECSSRPAASRIAKF
jgi:hypothetical protein